jgi:hypothetical protein
MVARIEETRIEETRIEETRIEETRIEETRIEETRIEETRIVPLKVAASSLHSSPDLEKGDLHEVLRVLPAELNRKQVQRTMRWALR